MSDFSKINAKKAEIRKIYRARRMELDPDEIKRQDLELCERILASEEYKNAKTVLLYCPMKREIDVMPVFRAAIADGKRTAFPRCEADHKMTFYYVSSENDFELGEYGIREPTRESEAVSESEYGDSVCVVPGLVFDREGYRVGYGGGYYDRFLANYTGNTIAPVRDGFLYDGALPRDEFDRKVRICHLW